jgi:hypothetical protein
MKEKKKKEEFKRYIPNPFTKKRFQSETSESEATPIVPRKSLKSRLTSFKVRTISSIIMFLAFLIILSAGHAYCCLLVLFINICIFKEIIALKRNSQREAKLPYFYIINWYFFAVTELLATCLLLSHKMVLSNTLKVKFI